MKIPRAGSGSDEGTSIAFVGTYPPTVCGIASYTAGMVAALIGNGVSSNQLGVVGLTDVGHDPVTAPIIHQHLRGDLDSLRTAARMLNGYDVVSIQHEFGIYAGSDGSEILELMSRVEVPMVVTLHTVLSDPTPNQKRIVEGICALAGAVIVLSHTASSRLRDRYNVDPARINVFAHGADNDFAGPSLAEGDRPLVLTWGLIGPGKGLEAAIEAFAGLTDLDPLPRYLIAGATHPTVKARSGETYRDSLVARIQRLGLEDVVEFDDRYFDRQELARIVRGADIVVLPYESVEQVTSGVLVEAIAAAKPVVATAFPHAVELLSDGAGIVVPHGDPQGLGNAMRELIEDPERLSEMSRKAARLAAGKFWPAVATRFSVLVSELTGSVSGPGRELRVAAG